MTWFETLDAYRSWRRMSDWTTNLYEQDDRDAEARRLWTAEQKYQEGRTNNAADRRDGAAAVDSPGGHR